LSQIAHPLLKESGAGSVVFISSVAGLLHIGSGSIYGASKGEWSLKSSVHTKYE
jgi:Tropinone reductase 1